MDGSYVTGLGWTDRPVCGEGQSSPLLQSGYHEYRYRCIKSSPLLQSGYHEHRYRYIKSSILLQSGYHEHRYRYIISPHLFSNLVIMNTGTSTLSPHLFSNLVVLKYCRRRSNFCPDRGSNPHRRETLPPPTSSKGQRVGAGFSTWLPPSIEVAACVAHE